MKILQLIISDIDLWFLHFTITAEFSRFSRWLQAVDGFLFWPSSVYKKHTFVIIILHERGQWNEDEEYEK